MHSFFFILEKKFETQTFSIQILSFIIYLISYQLSQSLRDYLIIKKSFECITALFETKESTNNNNNINDNMVFKIYLKTLILIKKS